MSYRKELCDELDNIGPGQLVEPSGEIGPNDNIAGLASVEIKKICTLRENTAKAGRELVKRMILSNNFEEAAKLREEITRIEQKCDLLDSLLWLTVRDEFKLWGKRSVGIKKGFVVVWTDEVGKEKEEQKEQKEQKEKNIVLEDKEPGNCDKNCANCMTGHALSMGAASGAGEAAGSEMIGMILPFMLLSRLAGELKDLSAEEE